MTASILEEFENMCADVVSEVQKCIYPKHLEKLKTDYEAKIGSRNKLSSIESLEDLVKLLKKRLVLSFDNVKVLDELAEKYLEDESEIVEKLQKYKALLRKADIEEELEKFYYKNSVRYSQQASMDDSSPSSIESLISEHPNCKLIVKGSKPSIVNSNFDFSLEMAVSFEISNSVGKFWESFARNLNFREYEINQINKDYRTHEEKCKQVLKKYFREGRGCNWKSEIVKALHESRLFDIKSSVEKLILS